MDRPAGKPTYVVDTDALINLQDRYPRRTFGLLWSRLDGMVDEGRLLVPEEVQRELGDDSKDAVRWLQDHPVVVGPTAQLWEGAAAVAKDYPSLVDLAKPGGSADPFLIFLALDQRERQRATLWASSTPVVVVTQERRKRPGKVAIPDACDDYELGVTNLQGLFESEGWDDL